LKRAQQALNLSPEITEFCTTLGPDKT
jgi:hypothetical protein